MIIALFPNVSKTEPITIAVQIIEFCKKHNIQVVIEDRYAEKFGILPLSSVKSETISFILSLGGDGTILQILHHHSYIPAPLLGINLGGLGFMADVPATEIYPALQDLIDGRYEIQNRIMMEGISHSGQKCFAVNDMVIHRAKNPSLIDLAVYVDGKYLNTFSCDGLIIATPTGSTAYSLAAGGPILTPELHAFALTPISPHTISNRPIVLFPEESIQIQYLSHYESCEVSYDGFSDFQITKGEVFTITRSSQFFKLVNLQRYDYFSTLRKKLGWVGKLKP